MPPVPTHTTQSVPNTAARPIPGRENLMKAPLGSGPGVKINPHPMIHKNMDTGAESIPHHNRSRPPQQVLAQQQRIQQRAVPIDTSPQGEGGPPMIKVRMDGGRSIRQTDPTIRSVAAHHAPTPELVEEVYAAAPVVLPIAPEHLRLLRSMLDDEYERIEARRAAGDSHPELVQRAEQVAEVARKLDELLAAAEVAAVDPAIAEDPIQQVVQQVQQQTAPRGAAQIRRAAGPTPRPQSVAPGGGRLPMITSVMGSSGPMRVNVVKAQAGAHRDVATTRMPARSGPIVQAAGQSAAGVGAATARPAGIRAVTPAASSDGPVPGTEATSVEPAAGEMDAHDDLTRTSAPAIDPIDPNAAPFE